MKQCPLCSVEFSDLHWKCPGCQWKPPIIDGYPAFAPDLAKKCNNFATDAHEMLVRLESSCFWFRGRNKILQLVIDGYFPSIRNLLEIGCGTGYVSSYIAVRRPGIHITGADIYTSGLKYAKTRVPGADFLQMDACHIPYVSEFDMVMALDVLEHIDNDQEAINEIYKAVKKGGGIILSVPHHRWLWSRSDEIACHKRRYSRQELIKKLELAGFRIEWISSFVTLLLPLMIISRLRYKLGYQKFNKNELEILNKKLILNKIFEKTLDLEKYLLRCGMTFPYGGSLLCVGKK